MTTPLVAHAEALASIGADQDGVIAKDIGGLFTGFERPDFPDIARQAVPQIIGQHAGAAGLITATWYDELAPASKFRAKPYSDVPIDEIEKTVNWALYAPGDEPAQSRLTTASQRLVRNVSRETVTRNAQDEGVMWARHARAEACAFCRILAGRGMGRSDRKGLYESEYIAIFQGAKGSHPGEKYHRHCVPAGTLVSGPRTEAAYRRRYEGEAVVIYTATGQKLTITPNHPVLTDQGWVPAGLLQCGDNVVRSCFSDAMAAAVPHEHQQPALIEDIWGAAAMLMLLTRMPGAAEDFHGDGCDGEVDIVWADRSLGPRCKAAGAQVGRKLDLVGRYVPKGIGFTSSRSVTALLERPFTAADRVMRRGRQPGTFVGACAAHADLAGFLSSSRLDAQFRQSLADHVAIGVETVGYLQLGELLDNVQVVDRIGVNVESVGPRFDPAVFEFTGDDRGAYACLGLDLMNRLAGQIELDGIVQLDRISLRDHVYNLQTEQGWYSANSIVVSNCHCVPVPVRAGTRFEPADYVMAWDEEYQRAVRALRERGVTATSGPKRGQPGFDKDWWLKQVVAEMEDRQRTESRKQVTATLAPVRQKLADELGVARNWEQLNEAARMAGIKANFTTSNQNIRGVIDQAKQVVRAVDDVRAEFPTVKVAAVGDGINPPDVYAWTNHIGRENYISINKTWLEDPPAFRGSWTQTVKNGYHYSGTGDPAYDATVHELGHAVHNAANADGAKLGADDIERALVDYYLDTHPGANKYRPEGFKAWKKANLSGYSSGPDGFTDSREAIAEAFADSFINGDDAHDTSKVITWALTNAVHGKPYAKPDDWGFTAPSQPPQVMNYRPGSAVVPAVVATGAQSTVMRHNGSD